MNYETEKQSDFIKDFNNKIMQKRKNVKNTYDGLSDKEKTLVGSLAATNAAVGVGTTKLKNEFLFPKMIEKANKFGVGNKQPTKLALNAANKALSLARTKKGKAILYSADIATGLVQGAGIGAGIVAKKRHDEKKKTYSEKTASEIIEDILIEEM